MSIEKKYLIVLFLSLAFIYFGCSSGEYETETHEIEYVEKTLKIDTVKKVPLDTVTKKENTDIKNPRDSYSYIVQIGAFIIKENFERFFESAKQRLGEDVFYELSNTLYKIRIGKYSDKAESLKQLDYVKSRGFLDAFIISVKK